MEGKVSAKDIRIASGQSTAEREYWLNELSGTFEKTGIHYDHIVTAGGEGEGEGKREPGPGTGKESITLSRDLYSSLMKLSKGSDTKLFMILTAGIIGILNRCTGREDIIVGAPIYKQEVEGEFINTILPIRSRLKDNTTFKELLIAVRQTIMAGYKNQNYPMTALLEELGIPFPGNEFPLFEIAVLLENIHDKKYIRHTNPSLYFSFRSGEDGVEMELEYDTSRYERQTMVRIAAYFTSLLQQALSGVNRPLSRLEIMSPGEKEQVLETFNRGDAGISAGVAARIEDKTIPRLYEDQVRKNPAETALVVWGEREQETGGSGGERTINLCGLK